MNEITAFSDFQFVVSIFTVVGVIIAIFVAFYTVKNDKKNLKLNGLNLVFQKINNQETRDSRSKILYAYAKYLKDKKLLKEFSTLNYQDHPIVNLVEIDPSLKSDIIRVKSDFEEIAIMEKNGMVDEVAYFEAYWGLILRCYAALHGNIISTRERYDSNHTIYFEQQCDRAVWYWRINAGNSTLKFHPKSS